MTSYRQLAACALPPVLLTVAVLLTHAPLLSPPGEFTPWDDLDTVAENPHVGVAGRPATPGGLLALWAEPRGHLYIPVTYTAWWVVGAVADSPAAFKWASVLVHLAVCLLLLRVVHACTGSRSAAFAAALLFSVHPLTVGTVAWVSGLKDLLAAGLGLAAVAVLVRGRGEGRAALGATALLALALLAKPSAVAAVPVAALWLLLGRYERPVAWLNAGPVLATWAAMALSVALYTRQVQPPQPTPTVSRVLVASDALAWYATKTVWPGPSSGEGGPAVDHGRHPLFVAQPGRVTVWTHLLSGGLLAVSVGGLLWRPSRPVALPLASGVLAVSPYSGLVGFDFQAYSTVAEHYAYPFLLGVAVAAGSAAAMLTCRLPGTRLLLTPVAALLAVPLALNSHARYVHWRDGESLFRQTLLATPHSVAALNNLASLMLDRIETAPSGRPSELATARSLLEHLDAERPRLPGPLRAVLLLNQGRLAEAEGDAAEAARHYAAAVAEDDTFAEPYFRLGRLLARQGQGEPAERAYSRALELGHPRAGANLAGVLLAAGRPAEAEAAARAELAIDPASVAAAGNLSAALLQLGRVSEAERMARNVADRSAAAANVLGILAAQSGDLSAARGHFETAVRLDPEQPAYRANLEKVERATP
ncbi:MAG: tetratricopeptide repeat protein [Tepidisphaerales bacterium]